MNANEARKNAEQNIDRTTSEKVEQIITLIQQAVSKGEFSICFDGGIKPAVYNHFRSEGFKVDEIFDRNETYTKISW